MLTTLLDSKGHSIHRNERGIRNRNTTTALFQVENHNAITNLPRLHPDCSPAIGDVFINAVENKGIQIWVLIARGDLRSVVWKPVVNPHKQTHPLMPDLLLSFVPSGEPSWIVESTAKRARHTPMIYRNS
jgi:hypothetical protein